MPRGDATGPIGMGPMTGRGAGYCAGLGAPGYMNHIPARRFGAGFGRGAGFGGRGGRGGGFGFGNRFYAAAIPGWRRTDEYSAAVVPPDPHEEQQALRTQAEFLQRELDAIKKRLDELKTDTQNN